MTIFGMFLFFVLFVGFLIFRKSIKNSILSLFGGSVQLPEAAGMIFLGLFIYMIIKEGNRDHEWSYYNELYIFFTAGAAMTGLGLQHVLEVVKDMKTGNPVNKTEENGSETTK